MGVYKFRAQFMNKLPPGRGKSRPLNDLNVPIDHLLIDANGVLHQIAGLVYAYREDLTEEVRQQRLAYLESHTTEEVLESYRQELFNDLDKTLGKIKPRKTVVIAVDGVAVLSKLSQQRSRRYDKCITDSEVGKALWDPLI